MTSSDQQPLTKKDKKDHKVVASEPLPKRRLCNGYCCFKLLVVLYGLLYFAIGVLLLSVGLWVASVKRDFSSVNDALASPSILMMVVGILIVATALIGIIGALREHLNCLRVFLGIVIIIFILQVIIGILAFVYREETVTMVSSQLNFAVEEYHTDEDLGHAVDRIQEKLKCCGLDGPQTWERNEFYSCSTPDADSAYTCSVPDSCCMKVREDCGLGARRNSSLAEMRRRRIYTIGCTDLFRSWLAWHLNTLGPIALSFAIVHILGIFVVYWFITKMEDRRHLFKYRQRYFES
ncbi:hypothetical protein CAPTEDRAFT_166734 [Capitella teleta]|uniref:Tetraspanin n=1 Tax=Capitella teleta TaxID=283909 RepID=R7URJ2_CAPTE|nr:hypothetical protein CAPTEDRAFT_166734 [Capitella teleta]|eukprot:ELU06527.1 hypothetical protein CAPTEDRAFT_166734 [Capitella teleta]